LLQKKIVSLLCLCRRIYFAFRKDLLGTNLALRKDLNGILGSPNGILQLSKCMLGFFRDENGHNLAHLKRRKCPN
jgi:hypothetical protein